MEYLNRIGEAAKKAARHKLSSMERNNVLRKSADMLREKREFISEANRKDIEAARQADMKPSLVDRLKLNNDRIESMAQGLEAVAALGDPLGDVVDMRTLPNGLVIGQKSVPMGVIGMIYEARPNVTADAYGLCFKAGSAVILRGGKEAINSNKAIVEVLQDSLGQAGVPRTMVQLITETSREVTVELMKLSQYVDVLIPRGGAGLIQSVVENSRIPVIETGVGNCHIFVDASADFDKAVDIIINAKAQRPGVCNACEKLLVHKDIAPGFLPLICRELSAAGVLIRGDEKAVSLMNGAIAKAAESDWPMEYLDYIIAIKVVEDIGEAIAHIDKYSTGHSEAILTESYANSQRFLDEVDSAAVYVNASTRFTDGFEFGLGAEIGISTQKLHARGPMGLKALTTRKYIIYGNGHIRP